MPFDGIVTYALVDELVQKIEGGRITKIHQPTDHEVFLTIRKNGQNKSLLLSAHPSYARVHLTDEKLANPKEPPLFCMVLRKYLQSGFIEKIEQIEMERIIRFTVKSRDDLGDLAERYLYVELMGKHSHILLVDPSKNVILDSIKHISFAQNRHRAILPGQPYLLPPEQGKINPLDLNSVDFVRKLDFNQGKIDQQIINMIMGISPVVSQSLANEAYLGDAGRYKEVFETFQKALKDKDFDPKISYSKKEDFHVLKSVSFEEPIERFSSVSQMLNAFYQGKAERDRLKGMTHDLVRLLKNESQKNMRKIKKLNSTLKKAEKADSYQRDGELLTAHLHLVSHGDESVEVIDYYDPDQSKRTIRLDPNKSPSENAQHLFKQYQKLKKSKAVVSQEIERANQEIEYLDRLLQQLEDAREADLEEIKTELQEEGYLKVKQDKTKKKKKQLIQLDSFTSSDGTEILLGRNNKQNEFLTNRKASKEDIWLHTKDIPGSHVVIRHPDPSEETIKEAAMIAAFHSKARHSSSVPVDFTKIKHVRKPSGAKPGYVIYDNQQTVYVTPDEQQINLLKN